MVLLVVLAQQVVAKIVLQVANDAVHVVGVILRIVVLDQKVRSLNTVIVAFASLERSSPAEVDIFQIHLVEVFQRLVGDVGAVVTKVFLDDAPELGDLLFLHLGSGDAKRLEALSLAIGFGDDVSGSLVGDDASLLFLGE